ncbi:four helix bundle protein [Alcanivorax sp. S6407]|uniref:four helix bundle protein n=1 Tax=Alcanivorax sp. S6407 TaxID=2926424 RepID=UPI001FF524D6|nr:four helix bundle protein [Alcanivorax sp. S6407]MCK0152824.1 four helix bundle protein [Alcanivorax sp. S6407]
MRFEEMEVWCRSVALSVEMFRHFKECRDYGFKDQITRSALSVPSNIAEGFERVSLKDRGRFWSYAKGSVGELRTQVHIGSEIDYIDDTVAGKWLSETDQLSRMLGALIHGIRRELNEC